MDGSEDIDFIEVVVAKKRLPQWLYLNLTETMVTSEVTEAT